MRIRPLSAGNSIVYIPVDLPITLLGTPQKLSEAEICYQMEDEADKISLIEVQVLYENGGGPALLFDSSEHASTSWDCLELSTTSPEVITGPLFLHITLDFSGTGAAHYLRIGKILLTLTED